MRSTTHCCQSCQLLLWQPLFFCSACCCCFYCVIPQALKLSALLAPPPSAAAKVSCRTPSLTLYFVATNSCDTANVCVYHCLLYMLPLPLGIMSVFILSLYCLCIVFISHHPSSAQALCFVVANEYHTIPQALKLSKQQQWYSKFVSCNCSVRFLRRTIFLKSLMLANAFIFHLSNIGGIICKAVDCAVSEIPSDIILRQGRGSEATEAVFCL